MEISDHSSDDAVVSNLNVTIEEDSDLDFIPKRTKSRAKGTKTLTKPTTKPTSKAIPTFDIKIKNESIYIPTNDPNIKDGMVIIPFSSFKANPMRFPFKNKNYLVFKKSGLWTNYEILEVAAVFDKVAIICERDLIYLRHGKVTIEIYNAAFVELGLDPSQFGRSFRASYKKFDELSKCESKSNAWHPLFAPIRAKLLKRNPSYLQSTR